MIVRRVCSWCRTTMGLLIDPTMHKDTHGGCMQCLAKWRAQYMPHKREEKVSDV